jgi:hypothetical protein
MSQRLSTLEERQHEMHTSMGFETPELVVYPPFPSPTVGDLWARYHNIEGNNDDDDEIDENSE